MSAKTKIEWMVSLHRCPRCGSLCSCAQMLMALADDPQVINQPEYCVCCLSGAAYDDVQERAGRLLDGRTWDQMPLRERRDD